MKTFALLGLSLFILGSLSVVYAHSDRNISDESFMERMHEDSKFWEEVHANPDLFDEMVSRCHGSSSVSDRLSMML